MTTKGANNAGKKTAEPTPVKANQIDLTDKYENGELDLSMCDLQDVPVKNIATFPKIYSLDLSNNRIAILPKNFVTLTSLVKLDLSKNQLKELPENFGELAKLKHLDLYKNELEHLPLSFSKLQALKWLDLKDNPLMPKIKQIAGPCLDAKQCQTCAKSIVTFYAKLSENIQAEKEARQKQREKSLMEKEANAQKLKQQEKKAKKKQKQAAAEKKTNKTTQNGTVPANKTEKIKKATKPAKRSWFLRLLCYFVALVVFLTFGLFIATSLNSPYTKNIGDQVGFVWKTCLDNLPTDYKPIAVEVENHFKRAHNVTGQEIGKLFDKLF